MSQSGRKYIYRSRAEWSRLLAEYEAGDTTQRDFCVERGLTYSLFCRWRRRLRTEAPDDGPVGPLIELPTLSGLSAGPGDWRVELDLGNGCQCRMNNTHLCRSKSYQFEV